MNRKRDINSYIKRSYFNAIDLYFGNVLCTHADQRFIIRPRERRLMRSRYFYFYDLSQRYCAPWYARYATSDRETAAGELKKKRTVMTIITCYFVSVSRPHATLVSASSMKPSHTIGFIVHIIIAHLYNDSKVCGSSVCPPRDTVFRLLRNRRLRSEFFLLCFFFFDNDLSLWTSVCIWIRVKVRVQKPNNVFERRLNYIYIHTRSLFTSRIIIWTDDIVFHTIFYTLVLSRPEENNRVANTDERCSFAAKKNSATCRFRKPTYVKE